MKTNFFAVLLILNFSVCAQEPGSKTINSFSIQDISIQKGWFLERSTNGELTDFKTLAPKSVLLNNNLNGFSPMKGSALTSNSMLSAMLGIQLRDKEKEAYKTNPLLRLGISCFSGTSLTGSLYKDERKTYDTIYQPGQTIYCDSVTSKNYNMFYSSEQLRLEGSLVLRTIPQTGWSLFAGVGISAGLSVNACTYIYYDVSERTESSDGTVNNHHSYYHLNSGDFIIEKYRNKNNFGASAFIP